MHNLKKELNLLTLTLYGIGIILGAGVYALIGSGAGYAGDMLWLAFLLGTIIALFTALSYAELSKTFSTSAAEYMYMEKAFNFKLLSFLVSWVLVCASIISASVVALAFGGYLSHLIGGNIQFYAVVLLLTLSIINYIGIRESAMFNNIASSLELLGLVIVIILGLFFAPSNIEFNPLQLPPTGFSGVFSAIAIIFFAFIGFEKIVNIGEEVKDSSNLVPKALIISLIVSSVVYVLLSIAALKVVGWQELANSPAPLTTVVEKIIPVGGIWISLIALFATSNTVLIILIGASRIIYGTSKQGGLPKYYSKVSSRGTPYVAIIFVALLSISICFYRDIKSIAELTDLSIFIGYIFVNLSLIKLRYQSKNKLRNSKFFNLPIFAVFGVLSSVFMLFYFEFDIWLVEIGLLILGLLAYFLFKNK